MKFLRNPPVKGLFLLFCAFGLFYSISPLYPMGRAGRGSGPAAALSLSPAGNTVQPASAREQEPVQGWAMLAGTKEGLFAINPSGRSSALYSGGSVRKILHTTAAGSGGSWVIMGDEGILVSNDLQNWEKRNQGLPVKTIKVFQDRTKSFLQIVQEIKDVKINPANADIMVCATKDRVYLSRDRGRSWTALPALPYRTNGLKSVAVADMPGTNGAVGGSGLTVFVSHSIYGVSFIQPGRSGTAGTQWTGMSRGLENLETTNNPDEVSDIAVVFNPGPDGNTIPVIYASQTFRRRVYKLDWDNKTFNLIWSDNSPFGTTDSLDAGRNVIRFIREGTVAEINYANTQMRERRDITQTIRSLTSHINQERGFANCVVIRENHIPGVAEKIITGELWLLNERDPGEGPFSVTRGTPGTGVERAAGREGIFIPVNHALDARTMNRYLQLMQTRQQDLVVVDMKDDDGRLRFTPNNPAITQRGRVFNPLNIDNFLRDMKERGIFTSARVVVFKDAQLAARENGRFAVWDGRNNRPWQGYIDSRRRSDSITQAERNSSRLRFFPDSNNPEFETVRSFYGENWVDPYSEEVWEYIAHIAVELLERGFDEIQFDYIRFPTDGQNLGDARYRWRDEGMDMESAILSFLRHIRSRVTGIISIDIYGANGWYRTGARTGQEVELLAPWVDIICPMYYPSHFEQTFLAHNPPEQRPRRIYYQGTLRTARIARGQIIVRPWLQAFYHNVAYDRRFYGPEYVRLQVEGVRAAGNGGLMYWNNVGRYDEIPMP